MIQSTYAIMVRLWRLVALAAAALLLHHSGKEAAQRTTPFPPSLAEAQSFFPAAAKISERPDGSQAVLSAEGKTLGSLVTTSPAADHIVGYSGPSNLRVALGQEGKIVGTKILDSADTPAHVEKLAQSGRFAESLLGWNPAVDATPKVDGVGGSTLTGLAMVEGIARRLGGALSSSRFPKPLTLSEARAIFPSASTLQENDPHPGWSRVLDPQGGTAGFLLRTSPAADAIHGYAGPTECLVAVQPDQQTLRKIQIRQSYDTEDYVERVVEDEVYLKSLTQWSVSEWPSLDFNEKQIEGVAGATMTSYAIAEGLRQRFKASQPVKTPSSSMPPMRDLVLWLILAVAALQSFTSLKGVPWMRAVWQALLIGGLGLWLGQFVSLALFVGWARNGIPWTQAAPLAALGVAAIAVPWGSRRQLYCHHLCPHGATQEWLARLPLRKFQLPPSTHRILRLLPALLLVPAFLFSLRQPHLSLGNLEPFDFWILGTAAALPAVLALGGLVISAFVPMAYCRYGCATGALLSFVRTSSQREQLGARDALAAALLVAGAVCTFVPVSAVHVREETAMRGIGFGTTWCVKTRGVQKSPSLHESMSAEIERIEATFSHWRPDSITSRFNADRSLQGQEIPEELGRLIQFTQRLSQASSGAYDITVGPLVEAWGYGPKGPVTTEPEDAEISALLAAVGWQKITLDSNGTKLSKSHPSLSVDLGSVLQGYAVDRLCELLDRAGSTDYLVEVGGELRARGAWKVAIENPADERAPLLKFELHDAALATSGLQRARKRLAGKPVSHIISPITGRPVNPSIEVCSVMRPTCLEADGWATALIASGLPEAELMSQREHLTTWILDASGRFRKLP